MKNQNIYFTICSLFLFIFFQNCNSEKTSKIEESRIFPEYSIVLDSVILQPQGMLRGIELGDVKTTIEKNEYKKVSKSGPNTLLYEYIIDSLNFYSVKYTFTEDVLSEIEVNILSKNQDLGAGIVNDLKNYLTTKYTAPLMDNGVYVFNCFDSQKKNFIINLSDNSTSDCGKILLIFYRED